jgi:hypothetical protein
MIIEARDNSRTTVLQLITREPQGKNTTLNPPIINSIRIKSLLLPTILTILQTIPLYMLLLWRTRTTPINLNTRIITLTSKSRLDPPSKTIIKITTNLLTPLNLKICTIWTMMRKSIENSRNFRNGRSSDQN